MSNPTIHSVKRHAGVAGQYSYSAVTEYAGEPAATVEFVGSVYGGPIVMVTPSGAQTFVSPLVTDRIGSKLDADWVRRFFA